MSRGPSIRMASPSGTGCRGDILIPAAFPTGAETPIAMEGACGTSGMGAIVMEPPLSHAAVDAIAMGRPRGTRRAHKMAMDCGFALAHGDSISIGGLFARLTKDSMRMERGSRPPEGGPPAWQANAAWAERTPSRWEAISSRLRADPSRCLLPPSRRYALTGPRQVRKNEL